MRRWLNVFAEKNLNAGTALVLMGAQWLYLWAIPWYGAYQHDPRWGHNYAEAIAFLAAGLAYFNRRLLSDVLTFVATLLIIPASLELLPHSATAIAGIVLLILLLLDITVERGRESDLAQPANRRLGHWLKRHLPRFSLVMLAHMALVYFFVRLPSGTYETDWVTKLYDALLFPFVFLVLLEEMPGIAPGQAMKKAGFFWGMGMMIVSLLLLSRQPETWPHLALTIAVTGMGLAAWRRGRGGEIPVRSERAPT
jgi:hypothetical protein